MNIKGVGNTSQIRLTLADIIGVVERFFGQELPCQQLLRKVFGLDVEAVDLLRFEVEDAGPLEPAELVFRFFRQISERFPTSDWTEEADQAVRAGLAKLSGREESILKMRYGIDCEKVPTLEEIGRRLNPPRNRERVRQIEYRALRRLRHPHRCGSMGALLGWRIRSEQFEERVRQLEQEIKELKLEEMRQKLLPLGPIEDLNLTTRVYNCFWNSGIRTVRELVVKTDGELLKIKNFGRKSLNEVKHELALRGLHTGMTEEEISRFLADKN